MGSNSTATFADPDRISGFLAQAEDAVRAQPGDGLILLLATTAALLDHNPARARVFLKRFSKRYVAIASYQLLRALVLAEENKLGPARSVLEDHNLTSSFEALQVFPGGWTRRAWLFRQHDRIFGQQGRFRGRGDANAARHAARNTVKIIAEQVGISARRPRPPRRRPGCR